MTPTRSPWTPEEIGPAWLTQVLRDSGAVRRSRVVDCALEALTRAPSFTGSFRRLKLRYDEVEAGAPASLVVKCSTEHDDARAAMHRMGFYRREHHFYTSLAPLTDVSVPRCYFSAVADDGRSLFLLEDLSSGRKGRSADACSAAEARLVVETLAGLHARWWDHPLLFAEPLLDPDTIASPAVIAQLFAEHWAGYLAKSTGPGGETFAAARDLIGARLEADAEAMFHAGPLTLIHHDCQADNIIFDIGGDSGSLAIIDWQLAVRARGILDIAYFLMGSVTAEVRRQEETALLERYVGLLAAGGVDYPLDAAAQDYRRALSIPPARLAIAVATTPSMVAHPGAFWEVLFARQLAALADHAG